MQNKIFKIILSLLILLCIPQISLSHEKHHHVPADGKQKDTKNQKLIFEEINQNYIAIVKPIFEKKCMNCHGGQTTYPWYYKFPFAKNLIDSDIAEAKKHLDFSNDFPFKGHGTPKEDLEAIAKTIDEGTMPPFRYWVLHWDHRIKDAERKIITEWTKESLNKLKEE